jgi:large subunit ribosomal protein L24
MNVKIKKGDTVKVISGLLEDQGKEGEVIKVLPTEARVVVQAVNVRTKHQRQSESQGRTIAPGKVRFEAPIAISKVMVVCPKCKKPTRVAIHREANVSVRFCKKCQSPIDD